MHKIVTTCAVVVVIALLLLITSASAQTISNGNFESWSGTTVANNWTQYVTTGTLVCYKGSTYSGTPGVTAHGGSECQRVKIAGSGYQGGVYQRFSSTPGMQYTVTAYLLTRLTQTTLSEAKLGVDVSGATTPGASTTWSANVNGDSSWTLRTVSVTASGSYITIFLDGKHPAADTNQCNVFFDDVAVSACATPSAPANVIANPGTILTGGSSTLSATVDSGCTVDWYTGSCGGTLVGSGTTLVVTPSSSTTYYPRARNISGGCISGCGDSVQVLVGTHPIVTIKPSNMAEYGWALATSNGGTGVFTVGGPVAGEYGGHPTWPMGRGGFYATCKEYDTGTPSTVWLGLDKLYVSPGVFKSLELIRLDQIKKIEYKTYVPCIPTVHFGDRPGEMNHPMQPIHCAIATAKNEPPGYLNRRWYVNMPWPYSYDVFHTKDRFAHWDDNQAAPSNGTTAGWYNASLHTTWNTWEEMAAARGSEVLVPTSTYYDPTPVTPAPGRDPRGWKSCGYDITTSPVGDIPTTGTGMAINFYVGARKTVADLCWYNTDLFSWWLESYGFRGCLDAVTIGVDFGAQNGGYVETTYNFEPEDTVPDLHTVTMTSRSAILPTGTGAWKLNPLLTAYQVNKGSYNVSFVGKVISYGVNAAFGEYFDLDDGTVKILDPYDPPYPWNPEDLNKENAPAGLNLWHRPLPVRVHIKSSAPYFPPGIGQTWSVTGYPAVLSWDHPIPAPNQGGITEVCGQLNLFSSIENCHFISN